MKVWFGHSIRKVYSQVCLPSDLFLPWYQADQIGVLSVFSSSRSRPAGCPVSPKKPVFSASPKQHTGRRGWTQGRLGPGRQARTHFSWFPQPSGLESRRSGNQNPQAEQISSFPDDGDSLIFLRIPFLRGKIHPDSDYAPVEQDTALRGVSLLARGAHGSFNTFSNGVCSRDQKLR